MTLDSLTLGELKQVLSLASAQKPTVPATGRAVVVVDRGWIFAGDMTRTADGYIRLERAVHVFKWSGVGFPKMISEWKGSSVDLRPVEPVEIPEDAVIFRVPVPSDWGIK